MGIFTSNMITGSEIDAYSPAEQELKCEGVDINFYEASIVAVAESEAIYNKAMKEIGIGELRYMEENGHEMIYEAVDVKAVFDKIKMFFKKLMDKVKAIFHAFIAKLASWGSEDKVFVKKYEVEFGRKWNNVRGDFDFKGYKFTLKDISEDALSGAAKLAVLVDKHLKSSGYNMTKIITNNVITTTNPEDIRSATKNLTEDREDILEEMRAFVISSFEPSYSGSSLDAKEFSEAIFSTFRNGETEKDSISKDELSVSEICNDLRTSDKTKKAADKVIKSTLKSIDAAIKLVDGFEKEAAKTKISTDGNKTESDKKINNRSEFMGFASEISSLIKSHREFVVQATGGYLEALKDRSRQEKAIMVKVIAHSDSKKMKRESYDYTNESYSGSGSFLDSIVLK